MLSSREGVEFSLAELFARAEDGCVSVGRAAACTMSMADQLALPGNSEAALTLSRRHVLLKLGEGQLQLRDNNTVNGTFVNGQRVNKGTCKVLNEGDILSLGG